MKRKFLGSEKKTIPITIRAATRNRRLNIAFLLIWFLWLVSALPKITLTAVEQVFGVFLSGATFCDCNGEGPNYTVLVLIISDLIFNSYSFANSFVLIVLIKPFRSGIIQMMSNVKNSLKILMRPQHPQ